MVSTLVIGGSGFIGSHIVQALEKRSIEVAIYDLRPPEYDTKAEYIEGSILDMKSLLAGEYPVIYHAAGVLGSDTTFDKISKTFEVNVIGMTEIMQWATSCDNDPKIINCGLIRDWLNPYMISKHAAAKIGYMYKNTYGTKFLDVRMTVVYGPRQLASEKKVVPMFIAAGLSGANIRIYGDGESVVNMMYAEDVANVLVDIGLCDEAFEESAPSYIDLANPNGNITVRKLAEKVSNIIDINGVEFVPMRRGQPGTVGCYYDLTRAYKYIPDLATRFRLVDEGLGDVIGWAQSLYMD